MFSLMPLCGHTCHTVSQSYHQVHISTTYRSWIQHLLQHTIKWWRHLDKNVGDIRFWPPLHVQILLLVYQDMQFLAMMNGSRDCNVSWSIALVQTDTWIAIKFDPGIQCCPDTESPLAPSSIPLISSSTFMMLTLGFQWNILTTRR